MSNGIGRVWAVNAEGGDEGRPNGVGPVYIENADQLGSKLPEPAAGDAGKVLGVLNSSGDIGWVEDQSGTLTQVQSDWAEDDSSQVSYIQNKPTLAAVATSGSYADLSNKPTIPTVDQAYDAASANAQSGVAVASAVSGKQDTISDLETIRSGAALGATAVQLSQLATVATSGSYADLSNKPTIPAAQVQSDWNQSNDQAVDYIKNKPTIPAAQVNSDWNASSGAAEILNKPSLATVATSGSYNDLSNKPSIPAAQIQSDWNQTNDQAVDFIKNKPTIPAGVVVDQTYSASSTNAQSGTAVADALSTINQVPASTSADEDKVLTVDSNGDAVWAAAQGGGGGSSYTFSAPLSESSGTVSLSLDSNTLKTQRSTTDMGFSNSLQNSNGYAAGSVGVSGTSDILVSMTIPISQDLYGQKAWQNKTILPILIGDTGWNSYSNQWVIENASVSVNQGAGSAYSLTCEFTINPSPSSPNYPTSLNGTSLGSANYLAFGVFDSASALTTRSSSQIYGASSDTATYQYGSPLVSLAVKNPIPVVTSGDNGKVLKATYAGGVGSFGWDNAPTELPASLGTAGQVLTVNSGATGVEWAASHSYTAGAGIDITSDVISAKIDNSTLTTDSITTQYAEFTSQGSYGYNVNLLNTPIGGSLYREDPKVYTFHIPAGGLELANGVQNDNIYPVLYNGNSGGHGEYRVNQKLNATRDSNTYRYTITGGQTFKVCFNPGSPYFPVAMRPDDPIQGYYYLSFASFDASQIEDNAPSSNIAGANSSSATIAFDYKTSGTTLSVDTDVVQPKLTAGAGIAISDSNEISVYEGEEVPITSSTSSSYYLGAKLNYNHLRIYFHKYNGSSSSGHLVKDVYESVSFTNVVGLRLSEYYNDTLGTTTFSVSSGSTTDELNVGSSNFSTVSGNQIYAEQNSSWVIDKIIGFNDSPFASQS